MTKKYLVVDDNDLIRNLLCFLFSDQADVMTAQNGQEALELVKAQPFDIVLTDYSMPVMNGIEFLEQARESDNDIYAHSLLLTGSIDAEVRLFSERNEIPLIPKPFSVLKLKEAVNALLAGTSGKQAYERRSLSEENIRLRRSFSSLPAGNYSQPWG